MRAIELKTDLYNGNKSYLSDIFPKFSTISDDNYQYAWGTCRAFVQDFFFFLYNNQDKEVKYSGNYKVDLNNFSFLLQPRNVEEYLPELKKSLKEINKSLGVKGLIKTEAIKLIGKNKVEEEVIKVTPTEFWKNTPEALSLFTLICRTRKREKDNREIILINKVLENKKVFLDHNLNKKRTWDCEESKLRFTTIHHDEGIDRFLKSQNLV